ncbi:cysteine proteinase [Hymenopellis radicata]|nr:cysteine proteinase [Hymenopellis radicata]
MNRTARSPEIDEAESTYSKAAKSELAKKYDTAFRLYIKSAEIFLHLSRSTDQSDRDKSKWKGRAAQALERAEKIKSVTKKSTAIASGATDESNITLTPVGIDHFSHRQQSYVLQKSSSVHGHVYPLWDEASSNTLSSSTEFSDPDGQPSLSPEQREVATIWRRPHCKAYTDPTIWQIGAQDIVQHIVTDCSVCASLSVCVEHSRRFGSKLARDAIHYDPLTGRCDVKILFNGSWRRVIIDDKLPHHPSNGTLMCMTCQDPNGTTVAWPSYLEKAYMKLMGGYDFPGSNSSIDLHALGGWIPEQLDIKSSNFERERTWTRIYDGFNHGHCMITLGTGPQPDLRWGSAYLLSSHSYAIINVEEDNKDRVLTVLDSWVPVSQDEEQATRTLRIPWSDVLATFEGIYLSWDPQLWSTTLTFHGRWARKENASGSTHEARARFHLMDPPQGATEVWVLLTRHVINSRNSSNFIALKVETEDAEVASSIGAASVVDSQGIYTNSAHVLTKCRMSQNQPNGILSMLASYDGVCQSVGFTLTIYASPTVDVVWETDVVTPPFTSEIESQWTHKSAGGNPEYPTFMVNPQYRLRVHGQPRSKIKVCLTIQTVKDLPVNITVLWSQGDRVFDLCHKDLVATSGSYRYGLARLNTQLAPGDYSVVLSAFEPQKTGPFTFTVESSGKFDLTNIPQEGAGMYSKIIRGSWDVDTAAGGPSFKHYMHNPIYEFDCPADTQIKVRLQLIRPGASAPLNVTILPPNSASSTAHITTSGAYDDAISGVVTPQMSLNKGKYWVVPSTYSPGVQAPFQLILYSSVSVAVKEKDNGS